MTFEEFLASYNDWIKENGGIPAGIRKGQMWFNLLNAARPDIANRIRGAYKVDPFYRDENLGAFFSYVQGAWDQ